MKAALTSRLLTAPGVIAVVDDRISWGRRAQGGVLPAIVLHLINGRPDYHHAGPSGLVESRVQVDCWATDADGSGNANTIAEDVAQAVKASLSGARFSLGGIRFDGVFLSSENEDSFDEDGTPLSRVRLDFIIYHATA